MRLQISLFVLLCLPSVGNAQVADIAADWGWLSDGRRFGAGDIITVMVDEYTAVSADRTTSASEGRGVGIDVGGGASGPLSISADGRLDSELDYESMRRGRDYRRDRFDAEVSVRVTEIEDGGTLRVEGSKSVFIDGHEQEVTVRGVIRPQDITAGNTVPSWRIAEVEVLYKTDGSLASADKSMISRLFGWIIP